MRRAIWDSFLKLDPRHMMGNPVMFVVEVGSVITTVLLFKGGTQFGFNLQITLWLWFTVLFANFAEAMAEGRGKAQADSLRKARRGNHGQPPVAGRQTETVPGSKLRTGDLLSWCRRRVYPRRRRDHRRRGFGGRIGHHRRVGARDSRIGRRPLGRYRRHPRAFRSRSRSASPPIPARPSWTA